MTNRQWNSGFLWLVIVWFFLLICFCLMGCKTKSVVELVEVHDTLRIHSTDTVTMYKAKEVHDTVREKEVTTITVTKEGDTLFIDRWRDRWQTIEVHDTTDTYKSKADSLQAVINELHEKETVKQPPWYKHRQR